MKIPKDFALTIEDIRYVRHVQLEILTGINASNFSAWSSHRRISERNLERIAEGVGMTKSELIQALELRRQDTAIAKLAQHKAEKLIQLLDSKGEEIA